MAFNDYKQILIHTFFLCHSKQRHNISFGIFSMWLKTEEKNTTVDRAEKRQAVRKR